MRRSFLLLAPLIMLSACQRESAPEPMPAGPQAPADVVPAKAAPLQDVIERTPRYLVGITYPAVANDYPVLADALSDFAGRARGELMEAVQQVATTDSDSPYDLSLNFVETLKRPDVVVVSADGSLYTGGAHGIPLVARFTYLPASGRLLQASELVDNEGGWKAISDYARRALRKSLEERMGAEDIEAGQRDAAVKSAMGMIDEGTRPVAENFSQFEPIPSANGKWYGLRFVFPPYQVGPYSDGTQTVEVPASVLLPYVAQPYRAYFANT